MREVFQITGVSTKVNKDEDVTVTVNLKTNVSPSYAGSLQQKLASHAYRYCIVTIESQQKEIINPETGEVS